MRPHCTPIDILSCCPFADDERSSDIRWQFLSNAFNVDGQYILGGSTLYRDNIYGNQSFGSYMTNIDRSLQYTQGLAIDLNRYVKGLNFNAAVSFDIFNSFQQGVSNTYAVYEATWTADDSISNLTKVGSD